MDRLFRIDFYPSDWLTQTARLTPEQRGLFIQIVAMIYANRGPIVNDPRWISNASNCHTKTAMALIKKLAELDFIQIKDGLISQRRADRELSRKRRALDNSASGGRQKSINQHEYNNNKNLDSSDDDVSLPSPSPTASPTATREEPPLPPPTKANGHAKPKRSRKPATHIGDDFHPDFDSLALAGQLSIDPDPTRKEFIDYWRSVGKPMCDWQAAFRNRLRQVAKYRSERSSRETSGRQNVRDVTGAALHVIALRQQAKA